MSVCSSCLLDAESGSQCLIHLLGSRHRQADAKLQLWRRLIHRRRLAHSQRLLLCRPSAVWRQLHHAHGVLAAPAVPPHHCGMCARHGRPCGQQQLSGGMQWQNMTPLPPPLSEGAFPFGEAMEAQAGFPTTVTGMHLHLCAQKCLGASRIASAPS